MLLLGGLLIGALVIAGFIAYWLFMLALAMLVAVFAIWAVAFTYVFHDLYIGEGCSIIATGLTIWAMIAFTDRNKASRRS